MLAQLTDEPRFGAGYLRRPGLRRAALAVAAVTASTVALRYGAEPAAAVAAAAAFVLVVLAGAAAAFGAALAFFLLAVAYPPGLGMGDVKLVLLIGATLGSSVVVGLLLGTLTAGLTGAALLARHGAAARRRSLAYAPFLCFGALVTLLLVRP